MPRLFRWLLTLLRPNGVNCVSPTIWDMAEYLVYQQWCRDQLRHEGWERVLSPPLVDNQWLWKHPWWGFKTQPEAVKLLHGKFEDHGNQVDRRPA